MLKLVSAFSASVIAGWVLVGSATVAGAHYRHGGCCGPIPPTYTHSTIVKNKYITRNLHETRTHYVPRIHRIVHVTDILPITHVHVVTHIHHQLIGVAYPVHVHVTAWLPPREVVTYSTVNTYSCGCR